MARAKSEIEKAAKSGIVLALVKLVRLAAGFILFFDREEFHEWAKDMRAERGIYAPVEKAAA